MRTHSALDALKAAGRGALPVMLGLAALLGAPREAVAACTGLLLGTCTVTISAASLLAFGGYDPAKPTPTDSTSLITVVTHIDNGAAFLQVHQSYTLSLSAGSAGTIPSRQMIGPIGSTPLAYNLYTNNERTTVWGNNSVSESYDIALLFGSATVSRPNTVYGRIPPGQYVTPGAYNSTITVTVTY